MSQKHPPRGPENSRVPKADWTAWGMHLVFGFLIGCGLGCFLALRLLRLEFINPQGVVGVTISFGLLIGALSSHLGNRLLMRASIFSPDEPPRSSTSKRVSISLGTIGGYFLALSLSRRPDVEAPHSWLFLPFVGILGGLIFHAFKTDTLLTPVWAIDRHEQPLLFWFFLLLYGITLVSFTIHLT